MDILKTPLLIYDSECTLCTRFKQTVERLDSAHKLNFSSIHQEEIYSQFPNLKKEDCHKIIHLIDENGKIHQGPEVIQYMAHIIPSISKFAWMLDTDVGKKALDFFYQKVNDIRNSQLNSCEKCKDD
ncbi:MAG: thiol-disulfide oxidoreductase DCC family protein [Bacteriovoracaceae bacterium]